MNFDEKMTLGL